MFAATTYPSIAASVSSTSVERRHDGRHRAVVGEGDARHLAAARGGRLQGVGERHHPGGDERAVLAERVPHHRVGEEAVAHEQRGRCAMSTVSTAGCVIAVWRSASSAAPIAVASDGSAKR